MHLNRMFGRAKIFCLARSAYLANPVSANSVRFFSLTVPAVSRPAAGMLALSVLLGLSACQEAANSGVNSAIAPEAAPDVVSTVDGPTAEPLTITSPQGQPPDDSAFVQVAENSVAVAQVVAKDAANGKLVYRLQDGEDKDKFVMDEATGTLSFKTAPDWEQPTDADKNNNYLVLWQVLNSTGDARSQFLVVQVTDLPD
jgi:hypothetical protein